MNDTQATTSGLVSTGLVHDHKSPFALPRGWKGRLAGWYMGFSDPQHRELASVVQVSAATRMLEIGFGPGQMLQMIHARHPRIQLAGVDPSELMVARARRRNPGADLRVGAAAAIPFPDGHADIVLSVNNVPMWPDLGAGLAELDRVLAEGGTAYIAWHGGHDPRGHQRRLVLSSARLDDITAAIANRFPKSTHSTLQHSELWTISR